MSLFGKKVLNNEELEKEIEAQKQLVENEINLYRRRRMLDMDMEIENAKLKRLKEVADMEATCHKQLAEYEHTFHQTKEDKRTELAKIQAKIDFLKEKGDCKDALIEAKDAEIKRLNELIKSITSAFTSVITTKENK